MDTEDPAPSAFAALGLDARIVSELAALGYEEPTPIQSEAIVPLLAGRDLLGQAATGTGKTAAFALPLLQRLGESRRDGARALVLVPTRELAMQVAEAVHRYGRRLSTQVLPIYGGQSMLVQLRALKRGVDVVVATPGRALDHVRRGTLPLDRIQVVVLDEADEMLDMGFAEDLEAILDATPKDRQTALFSATMPRRIAAIAERHLKDPVRIAIAAERSEPGELPRIRQVAYLVQRVHKVAALSRVLDMESPAAALVFCRTRNEVDELSETLNGRGYRAEALHGGLSQEARDRVMRRFREGTAELLLATDVAARGLDVEHLSHVINFDVPSNAEGYVHRIGRTGRAGREGAAITIAQPREQHLLRNIEQFTRQKIQIRTVPTIADLRAHRLERTRTSVREALTAGGLEPFRAMVEALGGEYGLEDVAAAAFKLAHEAGGDGEGDETEIPQVSPMVERPSAPPRSKGREKPWEKRDKPAGPRDKPWEKRERPAAAAGEKKPWEKRPAAAASDGADKKPWEKRPAAGEKKPWAERPAAGEKKPWEKRPAAGEKKPWEKPERAAGPRERGAEDKPWKKKDAAPAAPAPDKPKSETPWEWREKKRAPEAAAPRTSGFTGTAPGSDSREARASSTGKPRLAPGGSRRTAPESGGSFDKDAPVLGVRPYEPASRPERGAKASDMRKTAKAASAGKSWETTKLYVSIGKTAGVRANDLVGAIANEAKVETRAIGTIEIEDRFSLVEVRESSADAIIEALQKGSVKGKRVTVSRYRAPGKR